MDDELYYILVKQYSVYLFVEKEIAYNIVVNLRNGSQEIFHAKLTEHLEW